MKTTAANAMKKICEKKIRRPANVPYVRHGAPTAASRNDKANWRRSLSDLLNRPVRTVIGRLKKDGTLPEWSGATCPHCHVGTLGPLKKYLPKNGGWAHRCGHDGCRRHMAPRAFHPIFAVGTGQSHVSLAGQAAILFVAVSGCSPSQARKLLKHNHKTTQRIYSSLHAARAKNVSIYEKKIKFGKPLNWADVEADEVDLAKTEVPNAGPHTMKPIQWDQWGGIVQRGDPKSLVLFKLRPERTKRRAPGPGPIRKRDWAPLAEKWLKNRAVILHTDGAKSYRTKVDGVKHDWVVHMKKKIRVRGNRGLKRRRAHQTFTHCIETCLVFASALQARRQMGLAETRLREDAVPQCA